MFLSPFYADGRITKWIQCFDLIKIWIIILRWRDNLNHSIFEQTRKICLDFGSDFTNKGFVHFTNINHDPIAFTDEGSSLVCLGSFQLIFMVSRTLFRVLSQHDKPFSVIQVNYWLILFLNSFEPFSYDLHQLQLKIMSS